MSIKNLSNLILVTVLSMALFQCQWILRQSIGGITPNVVEIVDHLQCCSGELRTINKEDYAFVNKSGTVNNEKLLTIDMANRRSAHERNIFKNSVNIIPRL
jgi:hypothetical protein